MGFCAHRRREKCGRRLTARQQEGFRRGIASPTAGNSITIKDVPAEGRGCCDSWARCVCRDVRRWAAFVVNGPTTTLFRRRWTNHDIPIAAGRGFRTSYDVPNSQIPTITSKPFTGAGATRTADRHRARGVPGGSAPHVASLCLFVQREDAGRAGCEVRRCGWGSEAAGHARGNHPHQELHAAPGHPG